MEDADGVSANSGSQSSIEDTPDVASPTSGTCHFFRLPLELRDQIYEEVLSEPDGLVYNASLGTGMLMLPASTAQGRPPEANQLKYVCRQMRNETRGLCLRFNVICFLDNSSDYSAGGQFIEFIRHCSDKLLEKLRAEIKPPLRSRKPDSDFWTTDLTPAADFCRKYPQGICKVPRSRTLLGERMVDRSRNFHGYGCRYQPHTSRRRFKQPVQFRPPSLESDARRAVPSLGERA